MIRWHCPTTEDDWHKVRQASIGSSDMIDLLGIPVDGREPRGQWWQWVRLNPNAWESIGEAGRFKYAEIERAQFSSINTRARLLMEQSIEAWLREDYGIPVYDPGPYAVAVHKEKPWHVSPDGLSLLDGFGMPLDLTVRVDPHEALKQRVARALSYKTLTWFARKHWPDESPSEYAFYQAQWEMMVLGTTEEIVAAQLNFGDSQSDRLKYDVPADPKVQELLGTIAEEFWRYVERDEPPPPEGWPAETAAIRVFYPGRKRDKKALVTVTFDPEDWTAKQADWEARRQKIAELEREQERYKQEIEVALGLSRGDEAVIPKDEDDPVIWKRYEVTRKARVCECGREITKESTYTKLDPPR